ncbi:MAG TPA: c-type cytochrome [Allosphingosinicella sp.]|nr:c-type cytochrome [Allosphingosinicella sp.]
MSLLPVLSLLLIAGCDRESREYRGAPVSETAAIAGDPRGPLYEGNAFHIAQGQRLFAWMNCSGCHAHGGGGMGPPLMDDEWRYGGRMEDIVTTILYGRPNGMPAFQGRITETQAWELAAFVRAMSAQPRQDVLPGRADELRNTEPLTIDERKAMRRTTPKADDATEE